MKRKLGFLFLIFCFWLNLSAQITVNTEEQLWLGVFNQTRFSQKWGIWAEMQFRWKDNFVGDPATFIARPGLTFYAFDDLRLTAGYAFINHFPGENHKNISQPEHRPWQQIQWFVRPKQVRFMQWLRLEQRFRRKILNDDALAEGFNFNWRLRFNTALFIPLTKKKFAPGGLQFLLNDEFMVNFGEQIVFNVFDQNRFFAGFVYQLNHHGQLHLGYMNLFQQQAAGNVFRNQHTIRLFYFQNFDLRKNPAH